MAPRENECKSFCFFDSIQYTILFHQKLYTLNHAVAVAAASFKLGCSMQGVVIRLADCPCWSGWSGAKNYCPPKPQNKTSNTIPKPVQTATRTAAWMYKSTCHVMWNSIINCIVFFCNVFYGKKKHHLIENHPPHSQGLGQQKWGKGNPFMMLPLSYGCLTDLNHLILQI